MNFPKKDEEVGATDFLDVIFNNENEDVNLLKKINNDDEGSSCEQCGYMDCVCMLDGTLNPQQIKRREKWIIGEMF